MEMFDEARSGLQNSMLGQIKQCLGRICKHSQSMRGDEGNKAILAPDVFRRCISPIRRSFFQNDKGFL